MYTKLSLTEAILWIPKNRLGSGMGCERRVNERTVGYRLYRTVRSNSRWVGTDDCFINRAVLYPVIPNGMLTRDKKNSNYFIPRFTLSSFKNILFKQLWVAMFTFLKNFGSQGRPLSCYEHVHFEGQKRPVLILGLMVYYTTAPSESGGPWVGGIQFKKVNFFFENVRIKNFWNFF